jgi:3-mercaptopyruvate sulfurtransferase SseA
MPESASPAPIFSFPAGSRQLLLIAGSLGFFVFAVNIPNHHTLLDEQTAKSGTPSTSTIDVNQAQVYYTTPNVVFVDCRAASAYTQSHIRNAISWGNVILTPKPSGGADPNGDFHSVVDLEHTIVLYDEALPTEALVSAFQAFRASGKQVTILDQGFQVWRKNKLPISTPGNDRQ